MRKIIAVANQKGGIGKTTTTINLCAALAEKGKKVLLVELDPQGNASASLGFEKCEVTVKDIILKVLEKEEILPEMGILHHDEGIDLMPANTELAAADYALYEAGEKGRTVLKQYMDIISDCYDYVLIDCPPSLNFFTINAFMAADQVMIPVLPEPLPTQGLQQLLHTIGITQRKGNPDLKIAGILFMNVDYRTADAKSIMKQIREAYGEHIKIFETEIPRRIAVSEAQGQGKSVLRYQRNNDAAKAFRKLAVEVE